MSVFAIGDPHLSFGTDKPMNIFRGWDNYVERLENNWRHLVTDSDTVVLAGDISWAMQLPEAHADFAFLNSLPGKKIILKGNHDYWWNTKTKMEAYFKENHFETLSILHNNAVKVEDICVCGTRGWFFDAEKDADRKVVLREAARLRASLRDAEQYGGERVVFLHYPPISKNQKCDEIYNVLVEENVKRCFYGHLHGGAAYNAFTEECDGISFSLISADYLKFCPKYIDLTK